MCVSAARNYGGRQGYKAQHWNQFMEVDRVVLSLLSEPSATFYKDFHPPSPLNDFKCYGRHILYIVRKKAEINKMELSVIKAGGDKPFLNLQRKLEKLSFKLSQKLCSHEQPVQQNKH